MHYFIFCCVYKFDPYFSGTKIRWILDNIEVAKEDGSYEESVMITDEKTIAIIRKAFKKIKWQPNAEPKMARNEDVKAT